MKAEPLQMRQLIRIRQRRVEAADRERQEWTQKRDAQAARIDRLRAQRRTIANQLERLIHQSPSAPVRATDLVQRDHYKHRLLEKIDQSDAEIAHEQKAADLIESELQQALRRWRQARASLDALEKQWQSMMREERRRSAKKDEMTLDDLSATPFSQFEGASTMNWSSSNRVDTPVSIQRATASPSIASREERGQFEQMMEGVKSRDAEQEKKQESPENDEKPDRLQALLKDKIEAIEKKRDEQKRDEDQPLSQWNNAQGQAQQAHATPTPAMTPGSTAQADFADLMARHVQQMLVSEPKAGHFNQEQQMLLRLSNQVLPNTQVMLSRNATGWTLKAQSAGRDTLDVVRKSSDKLVNRFNEAGLGNLVVETELQEPE